MVIPNFQLILVGTIGVPNLNWVLFSSYDYDRIQIGVSKHEALDDTTVLFNYNIKTVKV